MINIIKVIAKNTQFTRINKVAKSTNIRFNEHMYGRKQPGTIPSTQLGTAAEEFGFSPSARITTPNTVASVRTSHHTETPWIRLVKYFNPVPSHFEGES